MLMKIQISTLPSWVTGSRLSESLAREKVNVPPATPAGAALGAALGTTGDAAPPPPTAREGVAPAPLAWVGATAVTFWLIVMGAWVAVAAAGCVLAAGAGVAAGVPPQAARRALTALAPPSAAAARRS